MRVKRTRASNLSGLRSPNQMLRRAERECLDRHGGVIATTGDEVAAVDDEQVGHVVGAVVPVDHRPRRVVPHTARAAIMRATRAVADRTRPHRRGPGRLENLDRLLSEELHVLDVVGMTRGRDAHGRQTPLVFLGGVQIHPIEYRPAPDSPSAFRVGSLVVEIVFVDIAGGRIQNLVLNKSAEVCLKYTAEDAAAAPGGVLNLKLLRFSEPTSEWVALTTTIDLFERLVCGRTRHFSIFAVGYNSQSMGDVIPPATEDVVPPGTGDVMPPDT